MEATKTEVYNLIILDKSGSMDSIRTAAIDGYNETLGSIRAAQLKHIDTQRHFISLAVFCGCGVDMVYNCVPIADADKLTHKMYEPCCMTPLYDAIGTGVKHIMKKIANKENVAVLVTIITDGQENASQEWNGKAIKKLIEERKEDGWMFSYIGADHDVESVASSISITNTVTWTKTVEGTEEVFCCENQARTRFFNKVASCMTDGSKSMKNHLKNFSSEYYKEDL